MHDIVFTFFQDMLDLDVLELCLRNTSEIGKITVLGHFAKLGADNGPYAY